MRLHLVRWLLLLSAWKFLVPCRSIEDDDVSKFQDLVQWIREHDGFVHEDLTIVYDGIRGIGLESTNDTLVMRIPWSLVVQEDSDCDTVRVLERELLRGSESPYAPFLRSVPTIDPHSVPAFWESEIRNELQGLIPDAYRHVGWYQEACNNDRPVHWTPEKIQSLLLVVSYATTQGIFPLYHLMNHRRNQANTRVELTAEGVQVWKVGEGRMLYTDYSRPTSAEIYRDYGFIEGPIRRWAWTEHTSSWWSSWRRLLQTGSFDPPSHSFVVIGGDGPAAIEVDELFSKEEATRHMGSLDRTTLDSFVKGIPQMPTSVDEDEELLLSGGIAGDLASAVQFRLTFKRDLEVALLEAYQWLERDSSATSEL